MLIPQASVAVQKTTLNYLSQNAFSIVNLSFLFIPALWAPIPFKTNYYNSLFSNLFDNL